MYHSKKQFTAAPGSDGFTLIEVLVAALVLSVGLLGMASLQATSMRHNNDASMQTRANYIASDMADRMRANSSVAAAYIGNYAAAPFGPDNGSCELVTCDTAQMVVNDTAEWNTQLEGLPAGQGTIALVAGGLFTITVRWDEARTNANGTGCDPDVPTDLRCLSITTQP